MANRPSYSPDSPPKTEANGARSLTGGTNWKQWATGVLVGGAVFMNPYDVQITSQEQSGLLAKNAAEGDNSGIRSALQETLSSLASNHRTSKKNYPAIRSKNPPLGRNSQTINIGGHSFEVKESAEPIADTHGNRKKLYIVLYEGREYVIGSNLKLVTDAIRAKLAFLIKKGKVHPPQEKKDNGTTIRPAVRQAYADHPQNPVKGNNSHTRASFQHRQGNR